LFVDLNHDEVVAQLVDEETAFSYDRRLGTTVLGELGHMLRRAVFIAYEHVPDAARPAAPVGISVKNCCWDPEFTCPSMSESAMKPCSAAIGRGSGPFVHAAKRRP
jgi:hypothetical protein